MRPWNAALFGIFVVAAGAGGSAIVDYARANLRTARGEESLRREAEAQGEATVHAPGIDVTTRCVERVYEPKALRNGAPQRCFFAWCWDASGSPHHGGPVGMWCDPR